MNPDQNNQSPEPNPSPTPQPQTPQPSPVVTPDSQLPDPNAVVTPQPPAAAPSPAVSPQPQVIQPSPAVTPQPPVSQPNPVVPPQPTVPPAAPVMTPQPQVPGPQPPSNKKSKKSLIIIVVAAVVIVLAALVVTVLAATSSAPTNESANLNPNPTKAQNACDLVTISEASSVIGVPLKSDPTFASANQGKPVVDVVKVQSICAYVAEKDDSITVEVWATNPGADTEKNFVGSEYNGEKQNLKSDPNSGFAVVTGLGDEAYWDDAGVTLYVLKGDSYYKFHVEYGGSFDTAKSKTQAEGLARILLAKV